MYIQFVTPRTTRYQRQFWVTIVPRFIARSTDFRRLFRPSRGTASLDHHNVSRGIFEGSAVARRKQFCQFSHGQRQQNVREEAVGLPADQGLSLGANYRHRKNHDTSKVPPSAMG